MSFWNIEGVKLTNADYYRPDPPTIQIDAGPIVLRNGECGRLRRAIERAHRRWLRSRGLPIPRFQTRMNHF